jgi:hypothetical protein
MVNHQRGYGKLRMRELFTCCVGFDYPYLCLRLIYEIHAGYIRTGALSNDRQQLAVAASDIDYAFRAAHPANELINIAHQPVDQAEIGVKSPADIRGYPYTIHDFRPEGANHVEYTFL